MEIKVPTHNLWRGQEERYAKEECLASKCKGLFSLKKFLSKGMNILLSMTTCVPYKTKKSKALIFLLCPYEVTKKKI